jgi:hypothetical protein
MSAIFANTNITLDNTSAITIPGTPSAGQTVLYPKADKLLYYKDDAGVERSANINLGTAVATTSGTSIDFTGIPAGVNRVTIMFNAVSTNGVSVWQIQLGTSAGLQTTGYLGSYGYGQVPSANLTTGFGSHNDAAADSKFGSLTLNLFNASDGTWTIGGQTTWSRPFQLSTAGLKTLSGTLARIRLTTVNGTDTFDAGSVNISWEF